MAEYHGNSAKELSPINHLRVLSVIVLLLVITLGGPLAIAGALASIDVPLEYQNLYLSLKRNLDDYEAYLESQNKSEYYPIIFAAELLPANSNRGTELLASQTLQSTILFLDRLRELGVQGVTIPVHYPLYTPDFPHYQEYVQFYRQVVREIRERDMRLDIESAVIFANTPFSAIDFSYAGLTFEEFKVERKQMIVAIIQDLQPDYLNLGAEPDTEYQLTGLKELNSPEKYTEYINYILDGLTRGNTKIGAGIGTWGNLDYVTSLASNTSLDSIHIHVYPVTGNYLQKIGTIAEIAKQHEKGMILDEAWLYKTDKPSDDSVAASTEMFRRDLFSFWAPLDQQFLTAIVESALLYEIEYVSPFWTQLFFGYVDYSHETANMPYNELAAITNRIAGANIISGQLSATGEFYKTLVTSHSPQATSTTLSSASLTGTPSTPNQNRAAGFILASVAATIVIGLVVLIVLRRRGKSDQDNTATQGVSCGSYPVFAAPLVTRSIVR